MALPQSAFALRTIGLEESGSGRAALVQAVGRLGEAVSGLEERLPLDIDIPIWMTDKIGSGLGASSSRKLADLLKGDIQRFFLEEIPLSEELINAFNGIDRTSDAAAFDLNYKNRPDQYDAFLRWLNIEFLLPRGVVLNLFHDGGKEYLWLRRMAGYELFTIPESDMPLPIVYINPNVDDRMSGRDLACRGMALVSTFHNHSWKVADEELTHSIDYYRFRLWELTPKRASAYVVIGDDARERNIERYGIRNDDRVGSVDIADSGEVVLEIRAGIQGIAGPDGEAYWEEYSNAEKYADGGSREYVGIWLKGKLGMDVVDGGKSDFSTIRMKMQPLWESTFKDVFDRQISLLLSFGEIPPPLGSERGLVGLEENDMDSEFIQRLVSPQERSHVLLSSGLQSQFPLGGLVGLEEQGLYLQQPDESAQDVVLRVALARPGMDSLHVIGQVSEMRAFRGAARVAAVGLEEITPEQDVTFRKMVLTILSALSGLEEAVMEAMAGLEEFIGSLKARASYA